MTTNVALTPTARQLFLNPSTGEPASGYKVFTYAGGTTTKLTTYIDSTGTTQNANPIILDTLGECDIWIPPYTAYKFVFSPPTDSDPPTNAIWIKDGIAVASTVAPVTPTPTPVPTQQVLPTGTSATYVRPDGCRQLRIRLFGGGGAGASNSNEAESGSDGGNTFFDTIVANGGGGCAATGSDAAGGAGGTGGAGTPSFRVPGNQGGTGFPIGTGGFATAAQGAPGAPGPFGGGVSFSSINASANSGAGGSGGAGSSFTGFTGGGGGSGEYAEVIINNPMVNYTYTVGAGGTAPSAGTAGFGGNGGSGLIIVDEFY